MSETEEKKHYNEKKVWFRAINSSLGFLAFGYANGIYTSSQKCISSLYGWGSNSDLYTSIQTSMLPLGALFGAILIGYLSRTNGKRKNLMIMDIVMIVGSAVFMLPFTIAFGIARLLTGVAIGGNSMVGSQYVNEFTPSDMTGRMGSINQIAAMIGLFISYSVCLLLPTHTCGTELTFYILSIFTPPGIISLVRFIIFFKVFTRESPYWLTKEGKNELALKSLASIFNPSYVDIQFEKLLPNPSETDEQIKELDFGYFEVLTCKNKAAKSSRLGILFHLLQQATGINAVLFYSTTIFERLGEGVFISRLLTIIASACRISAVFILFPIVDKSGRKKVTVIAEFLMSICFFLMAAIMDIEGLELSLVVLIIIFLMLFAISLGPICWIYTSEILNDKGMALCTGINWASCFVIVLTFPLIFDAIGLNNAFFLFGGFNFVGSIYFLLDMYETKGMNKEEIKLVLSKMR